MAPETFGDSLARRATDVATPRLTGTPARSLQMCRYEKSTLHAPLPRAYTRLPSCAYTRLPSCVYKSGWCRRYFHPTLLQPQMFPAPPWRQHRGFYDHNLADSSTTTLRILRPQPRHPAALAAYLVSRAYALFYLPLMLEKN